MTSFLAYEILGHFDVLLRVWLPTSVTTEEMDLALYEELLGCDYHSSDFFEVTTVHWHWVWAPEGTRIHRESPIMLDPDPDDLIHPPLSEGELEALDRLVSASSQGILPVTALPEEVGDMLASAQERRLITTLNTGEGIKIFAVVSRPLGTLSRPARDEMSQKIREIALTHDAAGHPFMDEVSVYSGHGFGSHIVAGRVHADRFYDAIEHLTQQINGLGVHEYKIRLVTYVTSEPDFLIYREALGLSATIETVALDDLLKGEEDTNIEFKATAFASIRSVIDEPAESYSKDSDVADSIAKTVGGFLNSADTGYLVIGVVEENAYLSAKDRYTSEEERQIAKRRLHERYAEYRPDLLLAGLEPDYSLGKRRDWDEWRQRLQQQLRRTIEPNPLPWITIQRHEVEGRDIAVISVRPNDSAWSYVVSKDKEGTERRRFYVREQHTTREYQGVEADEYKRSDQLRRSNARL